MPNTICITGWDFNPSDPVTIRAAFTFDLQDPNDAQSVANVLATLQGRTPQVSVVQTDNATISVTLTI